MVFRPNWISLMIRPGSDVLKKFPLTTPLYSVISNACWNHWSRPATVVMSEFIAR